MPHKKQTTPPPRRRTYRRKPPARQQAAPVPPMRQKVVRLPSRAAMRERVAHFPRKTFIALNLIVFVLAGFGAWQYQADQQYRREVLAAQSIDEPLHPKKTVTINPVVKPLPVSKPAKSATSSTPTKPVHDVVIPPIKDGLAPVISRLETKEPVVFLGIDDGTVKRLSDLDLMRKHKIKSSLFLANSFLKDNPLFFKQFTYYGNEIENHSLTHRLLSRLSYDQQKEEICGQAELQKELYGRRPVFFRPPGGDWNQNTQRAAADCGMKAIVTWIAKANGGGMQYQVGNGLRPGDIVLMHFRPEFPQDMQAFLNAQNAAGLHTELLTDWLALEPEMAGDTISGQSP